MAICRYLMTEPSIHGQKRGRLRLICKAWKEECDKLTTRLAPAPCTANINLVRLVHMLPNLTSLDLSRCSTVTAAGTRHLAPLAGTLEELVLPTEGNFKLHEADMLWEICELTNLSSLDLGGLSLSYQVLRDCGIGLPSLVRLRSAAKRLDTIQGPLPWQAPSGLKSLRLPYAELICCGIVVRELHVLSALQLLEVPEAKVATYGTLRELSGLSSLTELILPASLDAQLLLELEQQCTRMRVLSFRNYNVGCGKFGRSHVRRLRRALPDARVTVHFNWRVFPITWQTRILLVVLAVLAIGIALLVAGRYNYHLKDTVRHT